MAGPPLHPDLAPLAFLLGTWAGTGEGSYPTIEPFAYREESRFWHAGKPVLAYAQRTVRADDGSPLHVESGYWRPAGEGRVELVLAHPTGHLEQAAGVVEGERVELETSAVLGTPTAKQVDALRRTISVDGDELRYEVAMAAVGLPLTHHLAAVLVRQPD